MKASSWILIPIFLLVLVLTGCAEDGDAPDKFVRGYLEAGDVASCRYLTAPQAKLCRLPLLPEPPADGVVIERTRVDGDRATVRASYDWTGYRRHSTFALVRRNDDWLITRETPE